MLLSWVAAQTTRVKLGTMVTVLPWHDPVRVAESFAVLDHLSDGRAILGLGRGLGRVEFDGFRLEMGESRQRFTEYTEAILRGARDRRTSSTTASSTSSPASRSGRAARQLQGPHVRVGGLAAVDGPHGPAGRRDHGHRPEAVGHRGGGAGGIPPALPRAERGRGRRSRSWWCSPA